MRRSHLFMVIYKEETKLFGGDSSLMDILNVFIGKS